jgi:hypothetical protein
MIRFKITVRMSDDATEITIEARHGTMIHACN